MATKKNTKNTATLSTGIVLTFNPLPARRAQDLMLQLTKSQLMDSKGNVIDTANVDNLPVEDQMLLVDSIMSIVEDIIWMDGVVEVTLPKDDGWSRSLKRLSFVKSYFDKNELANLNNDPELKRFLFLRYVAIGNDDDFNVILNNTLLSFAQEPEESE